MRSHDLPCGLVSLTALLEPLMVGGGREIRTRRCALERSISKLGMRVESQRGCSAVAAVLAAADIERECS